MTDPVGVLLVDKEQGLTSHDVVAQTRRSLGTKKVGHAGTLDPMATGLLVLGVGRGTKLLAHAVGLPKTYRATIRLGVSTTTDDAEGQVTDAPGCNAVDETALHSAIGQLTGSIMQVPSTVSAIKVDGKRAYARVRAGEQVTLAARPITVHKFDVDGPLRREIVRTELDENDVAVSDLDVIVECSSGTYIRALARDLGEKLGTGGHLTALRRTHVGPWDVSQVNGELIPLEKACLDLYPQTVTVDEMAAAKFRNGAVPPLSSEQSGADNAWSVICGEQILGIVKQVEGKIKPAFIIDPI